MVLVSLIYASKVTQQLHQDGVENIVKVARANNQALDVTGLLCFDNNFFLQCLEGSRTSVNQLYAKIIGDPRHSDVLLLDYSEIDTRHFSDWEMGLALPTKSKRPIFLKHSMTKEFNPFSMSGSGAKKMLIELAKSDNLS